MWRGRLRLWLELALWLAIGTIAYAMSYQFDDPIQGYRFGATAWPRAIIVLMMGFAVLQFLLALRTAPASAPSRGLMERLSRAEWPAVAKIALAFTLPLIYLLLLPRTGFYLTTPLFLATYLVLLGERRPLRVVLVAAIIYALMIAVFTTLFYVPLPVGNWPGFYDINNWLLTLYR